MNKTYRFFDRLPSGTASDTITEGCLVLEGGGWKGLYTVGVLDALMENDINMRDVTGCSAGALSAVGYLAGQIGWGIRIDLSCRHDGQYLPLLNKTHHPVQQLLIGLFSVAHIPAEAVNVERLMRLRIPETGDIR